MVKQDKVTPGGASTNNTSLKQYVEENHRSLTKQFEILRNKLDSGPVIIYYFHPASRKRQEDLYNDLMDTVKELL